MTDGDALAGISLFRRLSSAERESLAQQCAWRHHAVGEQIVSPLDEGRDLYCIVEGAVRATLFSVDGKEVSFRDIPAGGVFGEYAAIDGGPRSAMVVALEDTLTASLHPTLFDAVLRRHPDIAQELMVQLIGQLRAMTERVFEFSVLTVRNRIHAEILRLARAGRVEDNTAVIDPFPTHSEIASRISTHREAVARELNALARDGLLERHGHSLAVRDLDRLARMVDLRLAPESGG